MERDLEKKGRRLDVEVMGNLWLEYFDTNGRGLCNPDIVLRTHDRVVVLECKLTQTDVAWSQIAQLYKPCLSFLWSLPVFGVGVYRTLVRQPKNPVLRLDELLWGEMINNDPFTSLHLTI